MGVVGTEQYFWVVLQMNFAAGFVKMPLVAEYSPRQIVAVVAEVAGSLAVMNMTQYFVEHKDLTPLMRLEEHRDLLPVVSALLKAIAVVDNQELVEALGHFLLTLAVVVDQLTVVRLSLLQV